MSPTSPSVLRTLVAALLLAGCAPTATTTIPVPPPVQQDTTPRTPEELVASYAPAPGGGTLRAAPFPITDLAVVADACYSADAWDALLHVLDHPDTPGPEYDRAAYACAHLWSQWTAVLSAVGWTSIPPVMLADLTLADLHYLGCFSTEDGNVGKSSHADIVYDPARDALVMNGPSYNGLSSGLRRYEIPVPVVTKNWADVPKARILDNGATINIGNTVSPATSIPVSGARLGGFMFDARNPSVLIVTMYEFYNTASVDHAAAVALDVSGGFGAARVIGSYRMGGVHSTTAYQANGGGATFALPDWLSVLWFGSSGWNVTGGHRFGDYTFGGASGNGPAAVAWPSPSSWPASGSSLQGARRMMYYGRPNAWPGYHNRSSYQTELVWTADRRAALVVASTRGTMTRAQGDSLLAVYGAAGYSVQYRGQAADWYGPGGCNAPKGWHSYPYEPVLELVDLGQIEAVLAGASAGSPRPIEERDPVEMWDHPSEITPWQTTCDWTYDGGMAYDPGRQWLFLRQEHYIVHVWEVR